jgi:hypothetical protein
VRLDSIRSTRLNTRILSLILAAVVSAPIAVEAQLCSLSTGKVQHIIYLQFDNVHFTRDNPNVPSDLEQMPNLLNFFKQNGTLLINHHTPLISHTADDILTSRWPARALSSTDSPAPSPTGPISSTPSPIPFTA